ncbi:MAG: DUF1805 domain-containing protein [Candidatus Altiarchaeota archaeon]
MTDHEEHTINLGPHNLVLLKARKGYVMCGLLNMETAEKLGHTACTVTGVNTPEDALNAKIKACTSKASQLGIKKGMTCRQALKLLR